MPAYSLKVYYNKNQVHYRVVVWATPPPPPPPPPPHHHHHHHHHHHPGNVVGTSFETPNPASPN